MTWLKQSTAVTIQLGPFLLASDGDTEQTSLLLGSGVFLLSKNGGAFATKNDSSGGTHDDGGWYTTDLDATDTGTLGRLIIKTHAVGSLYVWREFMVVPANVYDSLVSGSDNLDVEVATIAATPKNEIADSVWDEAISDHVTQGSFGSVQRQICRFNPSQHAKYFGTNS